MDTTNPYDRESGKEKEKEESKKKKPGAAKEEKGEEINIYDDLTDEDYLDDDDDDDEEESLDGLDEDYDDDEQPWYKKPIALAVMGVVIVAIGLVVYFVFIKKDPPPPPPEEIEEAIDPAKTLKGELYGKGIGKEAVDELNIYEQGSIESSDFRKDFVNTDAPENYVLPIKIIAVNDSVSYTKHRTMTDDGMDMYWIDAEYKGKKTRFTVPYYIWQRLAPQGVMDVIVEVVTDANDNTFITSVTAVPPSKGD